ncbi:MAG TPA: hypothetical protein VMI94_11025 [Bryobacteraceae bacterium]|nr:hypothetical protein [Bryobacteraceae bacterium]
MNLGKSGTAGAALLILGLIFIPTACKRHRRVTVQTVEEAPALASVVATADSQAATQLVSGFYGIEQNAWRWTAGKFAVVLRPPRSASTRGATLQLKFALPEVAMAKMKGVTLSASVNGTALPPETYTHAGPYTYARDVPAALLGGEIARCDFSLDKTVPPTASDRRELGFVVSLIGLQAK